jgi:hypothetical protein
MKNKLALTIASALLIAGSASPALAAETGHMPMQGMMGHHPGMMGQQGMMGQHPGMMGCPMLSGNVSGGMMGSRGLPALPPGNEKLQLQMHAEIMQKIGEVIARYASRIQ